MPGVIGRSVGTGLVAGVAAGLLVVPVLVLYGLVDGRVSMAGGPEDNAGSVLGGLALLALYGTVVGTPLGAAFGLVVGAVLGLLRPRLTGRTGRCRVAGLAVCGGLLVVWGVVLAVLDVGAVWWVLLCPSGLLVAAVAGWWRGPRLVDGRAAYP